MPAADWTAQNPTLEQFEFGYESDTGYMKLGPGAWNDLGYVSPTPGGGGGAWGDITGTVSDQTDLQAELDAKLDVDLSTLDPLATTSSETLYVGQNPAVARTIKPVCQGAGTPTSTITFGGLTGTVGVDVDPGTDEFEFAANIVGWLGLNGVAAGIDDVQDNLDGSFTVFYPLGAAANAIVNSTDDGNLSMGSNLTDGADAETGSVTAEQVVGYRSYVALMEQTGTDPITPDTIAQNSIGDIVWTGAAGDYEGTLAGAFPADKFWASNGIWWTDADDTIRWVTVRRVSDDLISLHTGANFADATVFSAPNSSYYFPLEIRVYPD